MSTPAGAYLVNCDGPNGATRSAVAFYNPFLYANGNDNTQPQKFAYTSNSGYTNWEGSQQSVKFSDGTKFMWCVDSNGGNQSPGTRCGAASDANSTVWSVFRDSGAYMFTTSDGYKCTKIYNVNA